MSTDRETARVVRSWLRSDEHESADRVLGAVLDALDTTPQRRATWWPARRTPTMNRFLTIGLGAAAVVVLLFFSSRLVASPSGIGGPGTEPTSTPEPTATATSEPSAAEPTSTPWVGLSEGPFVISDDEVRVTVDISSPGWLSLPAFEAISTVDDGLDPPDWPGGALLAWAWPPGAEFNVYGDPCQWATTIPETPATTSDEIAAGLAAQAQTEATTPVDVTVGGYTGKAVTLQVPMTYEVPGATREEEFGECDEDAFVFYGLAAEDSSIERNAQGPGQIDELWILDVNGSIVIIDATYGPAAPPDLVEELRIIAESASFGAP